MGTVHRYSHGHEKLIRFQMATADLELFAADPEFAQEMGVTLESLKGWFVNAEHQIERLRKRNG